MTRNNMPEDSSFVNIVQDLQDRIEKLERSVATPYNWSTYTPTWTNVSIGNGTQDFKWIRVGKLVRVVGRVVLGSTSTVTGAPTFTLPVTSVAVPQTRRAYPLATIYDSGTETYFGLVQLQTTTTAWVRRLTISGSNIVMSLIDANNPMVWTAGDELMVDFWYEPA